MASGDRTVLRAIVEPIVSAAGYDLEDLLMTPAGKRTQIRVIVDRDGGVDLDAAAEISRQLSERLDAADGESATGRAPYTLEVSSPGVGRPLTLPRHFRRNAGRLLAVTTTAGESFAGRVVDVQEGGSPGENRLRLLTGPAGLTPRTVPVEQITQARVEVEFGPPSAAVLQALGTARSVWDDVPDEAEGLQDDAPAEPGVRTPAATQEVIG